LPTIYVITPTYARPTQKAELTRLLNTLRNVPKIIWILVEDSKVKSYNLRNFLHNSGVSYIHMNTKSKVIVLNQTQLDGKPGERLRIHRGSSQRNLAIEYLRNNSKNDQDVVYFADDDNSYSTDLFKEVPIKKYLIYKLFFFNTKF
jgi:galactosylgalactosylxylosylprotein 3-beta-glucuronosyltransferase 3